jgi:hypothetical protein
MSAANPMLLEAWAVESGAAVQVNYHKQKRVLTNPEPLIIHTGYR